MSSDGQNKVTYLRLDSDPNNSLKRVQDIRSRFESVGDGVPVNTEFGLAFNLKKTASNWDVSKVGSDTKRHTSSSGLLDERKDASNNYSETKRHNSSSGILEERKDANSNTELSDKNVIAKHAGFISQVIADRTKIIKALVLPESHDIKPPTSSTSDSKSTVDNQTIVAKERPIQKDDGKQLYINAETKSAQLLPKALPISADGKSSNIIEIKQLVTFENRLLNSRITENPQPSAIAKQVTPTSDGKSPVGTVDYENGPLVYRPRNHAKRTDAQLPNSIVARRTQIFEKSLEDQNSSDDSDVYKKMKELGTMFRPKSGEMEQGSENKPVVAALLKATLSGAPFDSPKAERKHDLAPTVPRDMAQLKSSPLPNRSERVTDSKPATSLATNRVVRPPSTLVLSTSHTQSFNHLDTGILTIDSGNTSSAVKHSESSNSLYKHSDNNNSATKQAGNAVASSRNVESRNVESVQSHPDNSYGVSFSSAARKTAFMEIGTSFLSNKIIKGVLPNKDPVESDVKQVGHVKLDTKALLSPPYSSPTPKVEHPVVKSQNTISAANVHSEVEVKALRGVSALVNGASVDESKPSSKSNKVRNIANAFANGHDSTDALLKNQSHAYPSPSQLNPKVTPSIVAANATIKAVLEVTKPESSNSPATLRKNTATAHLVPPAKPPRTFQHVQEKLSPRQDGDGEECTYMEGYESRSERPPSPPHVYTGLPRNDKAVYNALNLPRLPATEDNISVASENTYDTLGRSSDAGSYDHYDTISQSELDNDFRPPTLPRRPAHMRQRPVTSALSSLDIRSSGTDNNDELPVFTKESPTIPSPTKRTGFKLKYLLPKTRRKDEMRKAASIACLADEELFRDNGHVNYLKPYPKLDTAGYAVPELKNGSKVIDGKQSDSQGNKQDKRPEKIRLKLNQAFSALRRPAAGSHPTSDGEEEEKLPDPEVLEERLKHCTIVKEVAIYASASQIKQFLSSTYAQLYDYAVIVSLRKNPDSNQYEPYVKYKFPPQVGVESTTVPLFCFPDADIWHKVTEYKSEAFAFVLTDITGTRQYGYCRRMLPPNLNNVPRMAEVLCIVSPLHAPKLYSQVLDEVEKRRCQNSLRAEEFLQAVYGRPMPSPGQSVIIRAMSVHEETETFVFTRPLDENREGICYDCLLNQLSVNKIIKVFASILLERKIIFIAEKLSTLTSCVQAFVSLVYPFSWQHTFIPLLPPSLIDVVCAPTPYIVGLLSSNAGLLHSMEVEMEQVLVVDLDNSKFLQRFGDEETILPKKLHRALVACLELAKSDSSQFKNLMVSETFLRFFLETVGNFSKYLVKVPGLGTQFQQEEFICSSSNSPHIMLFLQWFTETQMFEVYKTEKESHKGLICGSFDDRVQEWMADNRDVLYNDHKKFKMFKLFGKKNKK